MFELLTYDHILAPITVFALVVAYIAFLNFLFDYVDYVKTPIKQPVAMWFDDDGFQAYGIAFKLLAPFLLITHLFGWDGLQGIAYILLILGVLITLPFVVYGLVMVGHYHTIKYPTKKLYSGEMTPADFVAQIKAQNNDSRYAFVSENYRRKSKLTLNKIKSIRAKEQQQKQNAASRALHEERQRENAKAQRVREEQQRQWKEQQKQQERDHGSQAYQERQAAKNRAEDELLNYLVGDKNE